MIYTILGFVSLFQICFKIILTRVLCFSDLAAVAKAAVSGDQGALDMFDWNKSSQPKFSMGQAESIQMYFGTKDGKIYCV